MEDANQDDKQHVGKQNRKDQSEKDSHVAVCHGLNPPRRAQVDAR